MKPLTLEKAFNIAFFEKDSFQNFLSFKPIEQIKESVYAGRDVLEPTAKLKEYHKFINEFIFSYLNINKDVVFSYRKGSSTYDSVTCHANSKIFFNTDIKNFFPSVTREFAKDILIKNINNIPILDVSDYFNVILDFIIVKDTLPIGFSTSPSFSNACLYEFDNVLQAYCKENEFIYSRYSDDIIISSESENGFNDVPAFVARFLSEIGGGRFQLNSQKTKLIKKGNKIKLLGMVILPSGKISVDINVKKRLEHLIHFFINDKNKFIDAVTNDSKIKTEGLNNQEIQDKGVGVISGLLNHINTIDKAYLDKLRKKYGNAIIDMFFHNNAN